MLWRFAGQSLPKNGILAALAATLVCTLGVLLLRRSAERFYYDPAFLSLQSLKPKNEAQTPSCPSEVRLWYKKVSGKVITLPHGAHAGFVGENALSHVRWLGAQLRLIHPGQDWDSFSDAEQTAACTTKAGHSCFVFSWASSMEELPPEVTHLFVSDFQVPTTWQPQVAAIGIADSSSKNQPAASSLSEQIDLSEIGIKRRWEDSLAKAALPTAPIGLFLPGNQPASLDLFRDGPHALLAGTTGSGKSVALHCWIQSLAAQIHPDRLRLILLDYKGGTGLSALVSWPHVELFHTDLDYSQTAAFLRRINLFLTWRKKQFFEAGYQEISQWEEQNLEAAPPRVLIVLDEFQSMAQAHGDLLEHISQVALQGRSLGIHLLVATQKPQSAVAASLRSVLDLRIALRCAESADSMAVLGSAAASNLPRTPGFAIVNNQTLRFALPKKDIDWPEIKTSHKDEPFWPQMLPSDIKLPLTLNPVPNQAANQTAPEHPVLGLVEQGGKVEPFTWNRSTLLFLSGQEHQEQTIAQLFCTAALAYNDFHQPVFAFGTPTRRWPLPHAAPVSLLQTARLLEALVEDKQSQRIPLVLISDVTALFEQLEMNAGHSFLPIWNELLTKANNQDLFLIATDAKVSSFTIQFDTILIPSGSQAPLFTSQLSGHFGAISTGFGGAQGSKQGNAAGLLAAEATTYTPGRYLVGKTTGVPTFCQMPRFSSLPDHQLAAIDQAVVASQKLPPSKYPENVDYLVLPYAAYPTDHLFLKNKEVPRLPGSDFIMKLHSWDWQETGFFIEPPPELLSQLQRHLAYFPPSLALARPFPKNCGIVVENQQAKWVNLGETKT